MKKIIFFAIIIGICSMFFIIYEKNDKIKNFGNNISKIENIQSHILQINSYEACIDVIVTSNKTENKYKIKQKFENGKYEQEVLQPENINGTKVSFDGDNLKIENTNLNISKIYNHYHFLASNQLGLQYFVEDYKQSEDSCNYEKDDEIVFETTTKNDNRYISKKVLHVSKQNGMPKALEIRDNTQKTVVYILYNEIKIKSN